jgi:hypothetical protein
MFTRLLLISAAGTAFFPPAAAADSILVPDDYTTIAEACDIAVAGDTVSVRPGEYAGGGTIFPGVVVRALVGTGEGEARITIGLDHPRILFAGGGQGVSVLEGFEVFVFDEGSGPAVVSHNPETIIRNNHLFGGGLQPSYAILLYQGGVVEHNRLEFDYWECVAAWAGTLRVAYNFFSCDGGDQSNSVVGTYDDIGSVEIEHNTFLSGSGLEMHLRAGDVLIKNNVFWNSGVVCEGDASISIDYNLLAGFWGILGDCELGVGNLVGEYPTFCSDWPGSGCDMRLTPDSPGADDGEGGVPMGAFGVGCGPIGVSDDAPGYTPHATLVSPNPFGGTEFRVRVVLDDPSPITATVFDVTGREVRVVDRDLTAGTQEVGVPVHDLGAGLYYVRVAGAGWRDVLQVHVLR